MKLQIYNSSQPSCKIIQDGTIFSNEGESSIDSGYSSIIINDLFCQIMSTPMPVKQARQIIKALPFALEEQLANEIDDNHFHYLGKEGFEASALIISHSEIHHIIQKYDPDTIQYLPLMLPQVEQGISVCILDDVVSIRCSKFNALSVTLDVLTIVLEKLKNKDCESVEYYDLDGTHDLIALEIENLGFQISKPDPETLLKSIEETSKKSPINLMSGAYTKKHAPVKTENSKLKAPLLLVACLLLIVFASNVIQLKQYQQMEVLVSNASKDFYRSLFPDERVISLRRQFKDKLDESGAEGSVSTGFISLLGQATNHIRGLKNIEWDAIRFTRQKNELELNIIVDNIAQLDQIKQKLTAAGLVVDIASATATNTGKRIKGVMKVSKNG